VDGARDRDLDLQGDSSESDSFKKSRGNHDKLDKRWQGGRGLGEFWGDRELLDLDGRGDVSQSHALWPSAVGGKLNRPQWRSENFDQRAADQELLDLSGRAGCATASKDPSGRSTGLMWKSSTMPTGRDGIASGEYDGVQCSTPDFGKAGPVRSSEGARGMCWSPRMTTENGALDLTPNLNRPQTTRDTGAHGRHWNSSTVAAPPPSATPEAPTPGTRRTSRRSRSADDLALFTSAGPAGRSGGRGMCWSPRVDAGADPQLSPDTTPTTAEVMHAPSAPHAPSSARYAAVPKLETRKTALPTNATTLPMMSPRPQIPRTLDSVEPRVYRPPSSSAAAPTDALAAAAACTPRLGSSAQSTPRRWLPGMPGAEPRSPSPVKHVLGVSAPPARAAGRITGLVEFSISHIPNSLRLLTPRNTRMEM